MFRRLCLVAYCSWKLNKRGLYVINELFCFTFSIVVKMWSLILPQFIHGTTRIVNSRPERQRWLHLASDSWFMSGLIWFWEPNSPLPSITTVIIFSHRPLYDDINISPAAVALFLMKLIKINQTMAFLWCRNIRTWLTLGTFTEPELKMRYRDRM